MHRTIEQLLEEKFGASIKDQILSHFRILVIVTKSRFCACGAGECIFTVIPKAGAPEDHSDDNPSVSYLKTLEVGLCDGIYFQKEETTS